jgi:hypothetical protein
VALVGFLLMCWFSASFSVLTVNGCVQLGLLISIPMMSTWLLDALGCSSHVCFLCLLLVDNQVIVIHLVPNKRKASKANQCFVCIIQMTEATNV